MQTDIFYLLSLALDKCAVRGWWRHPVQPVPGGCPTPPAGSFYKEGRMEFTYEYGVHALFIMQRINDVLYLVYFSGFQSNL